MEKKLVNWKTNRENSMSKSMHITTKVLKGLTRAEQDEQVQDPDSDLRELARKSLMKSEVKVARKNEKIAEDLKKKNGL